MRGWGRLDSWIDALEVRAGRLTVPGRETDQPQGLRIVITPPECGTFSQFADYCDRRNAAARRAATVHLTGRGLRVVLEYTEWRDPEIVPDDVVAPGETTPRLRPSLAAPPARRALPPAPAPRDAWWCASCGYCWEGSGLRSDQLGPCPACNARWRWRSTPSPFGPIGGFVTTI